MGSSINSTTIRCEEGSGLQFVSVQQLTLERMTFISCGIILTDTENTLIKTCIFQDSIATDYFGSAVTMKGSTGNVSITSCTFQNNSAIDGQGGLEKKIGCRLSTSGDNKRRALQSVRYSHAWQLQSKEELTLTVRLHYSFLVEEYMHACMCILNL